MRLRAIVLAGFTSQAVPGCTPERQETRRHRPPPVTAARKPVKPAPCRPLPRTDASLATEADRLARAMLAYQPLVRNRPNGETWIGALAAHNVVVVEEARCAHAPLLSRAEDPYLLAAIQFHESSWRPTAVGARGEVGLMQVHGVALQGTRRNEALNPETNVRLGYEYLLRCKRLCGEGRPERWLSAFASGSCETRVPAARDFLDATRTLRSLAAAGAS